MTVVNLVVVVLLTAMGLSGCTRTDEHAPSPGARQMPGAIGTIELKPDDWIEGKTTWWKDSDGIDPAMPGCHIGTEESGVPNGRMFGEACLSNGFLVESNPGADELHNHINDTVTQTRSTATSGVRRRVPRTASAWWHLPRRAAPPLSASAHEDSPRQTRKWLILAEVGRPGGPDAMSAYERFPASCSAQWFGEGRPIPELRPWDDLS